jgi:hypothetical protein
MMEKRNVVEEKRTPDHELSRPDENWDKKAASEFIPVIKVEPKPAKPEVPKGA